jgi:3-oxoacyl-[acyl-carrier-protein] synthase II
MANRRAVLTGIGILSPLGVDPAAVWESLRAGQSGIGPVRAFDASALPTRIAGELPGFDARKYVDKKQGKSLKVMARSIQLAVAAAQAALDDGRVNKEQLDPTRFGVECGAGLIATELEELGMAAQLSAETPVNHVDLARWGEQGLAVMPPLWMLKYLPNMLACHVSILHNAQGPNNTITESDVASLLALGEAYRIIARDQADFFLVGGADSKINPLSMVRQALFQPLSKRNEEPAKASRPFDRRRDGFVIGEGGAMFVLEDREHARRRGARIYGEVVGFGAAFDKDRSGAGLARAIRAALNEAGIEPRDLDHVNAHGLSSIEGDAWEARALHTVFGEDGPPVFAPKSYMGNLGAGAGTAELAMSLLALEHGQLPPTLNYEEPDPACPVSVAAGGLRPVTQPHVLKVGFTDLGQCAAVVVRKDV